MSSDYEKLLKVRKRHHDALGNLNYMLECFGDTLSKREKYRGIDGMDAIWLYLIKTYHWTPAYVKSMSHEDIRFVLSQEMSNWTQPEK